MDTLELAIVLEKKAQILIWNVGVGVAALRAVLLDRLLATREGVLPNLILDLGVKRTRGQRSIN